MKKTFDEISTEQGFFKNLSLLETSINKSFNRIIELARSEGKNNLVFEPKNEKVLKHFDPNAPKRQWYVGTVSEIVYVKIYSLNDNSDSYDIKVTTFAELSLDEKCHFIKTVQLNNQL